MTRTTYHLGLRGQDTPDVTAAVEAAGARLTGMSHDANGQHGFGVWINAPSPENAVQRLRDKTAGLPVYVPDADEAKPFEVESGFD